MKNQFFILLFFSAILLSGRAQKSNFQINGKAHGFPDNTILYLFNTATNAIVDSTYIINESFVFKGYISEPVPYIIQTKFEPKRKPPQQYKYIWMADTIMSFDGTNGDLYFARVQGGLLQRQQNELDEAKYSNNRSYFKLQASFDTVNRNDYPTLEKMSIIQDSLMQISRHIDIEFIKEHPNYIFCIYMLDFYKAEYGKELTRKFFMLFPDELKNSKYGYRIKNYLDS